jgi:hypothetical protein
MDRGAYLIARYDLPGAPLHERLVIGVSRRGGWRCVCTPDMDLYMEEFSGLNRTWRSGERWRIRER